MTWSPQFVDTYPVIAAIAVLVGTLFMTNRPLIGLLSVLMIFLNEDRAKRAQYVIDRLTRHKPPRGRP